MYAMLCVCVLLGNEDALRPSENPVWSVCIGGTRILCLSVSDRAENLTNKMWWNSWEVEGLMHVATQGVHLRALRLGTALMGMGKAGDHHSR